jgi:hypothetical protein
MLYDRATRIVVAGFALWVSASAFIAFESDRAARDWHPSIGVLPQEQALWHLSYRRWEAMLVACDDWLAQQTVKAAQHIAGCAQLAAPDGRRASPAILHIVHAHVLAAKGAPFAAREALGRAYQQAPSSGWLAARRLKLAFQLPSPPSAMPDWVTADVRLILRTRRFHPVLHSAFRHRPELRLWLVSLTEENPSTLTESPRL